MMTPDQFDRSVREVLPRLHDYAFLGGHPLARALFPVSPRIGRTRAQRLRRLLLESIELISPPPDVPPGSPECRPYLVLSYRFVEGMDVAEITEELSISERQYYREQGRAIDGLVRMLWERAEPLLNQREEEPERSSGPRVDQRDPLEAEVERLAGHAQEVRLCELLPGVVADLAPLSDEQRTVLTYHVDGDIPPIRANRTLLRQALIQLLSLLVSQPEATSIHVRLLARDREVEVGITLRGRAQTAALMAETLDRGTPRYLVESIGGEWIAAQVARGSCRLGFRLRAELPKTVLAIEDNPGVIELLRRYLTQWHFQVYGAHTASEAVALAREVHPDVVLLDIMLPDQDGWEVLGQLRTDPRTQGVPIIVCSVLDEQRLANSQGVRAYLKKPFSQRELLDALTSVT